MNIQPVKHELIKAKRLTGGEGNYFFGYYDIPAWSRNGKYHLCHKSDFWRRMPVKEDRAEIGIIDVESGRYTCLDTTSAWNFQQGAMLTWNPKAPDDEILYNIREGDKYAAAVLNIHTGKKRLLDYPIANVDPMGNYALSINFSRMFDFRPGYGYAGTTDPFRGENHPENDGIYLIDLETGKGKLILSLDTLWKYSSKTLAGDRKILVNHITFNEDGSRFVFLLRYFGRPGEKWGTAVITANTDGSDLYTLYDYSTASHYFWLGREELLIYATHDMGLQLYLWKDKTKSSRIIDGEFFKSDGHCSFSPDKKHILYDSYWDREGYRNLYLYDRLNKKGIILATYYSYPELDKDIRCDLHPRWDRSGKVLTFDSLHEGQRHIYSMDVSTLL